MPALLARSQHYAVVVGSLGYIAYVLFTTLIDPPGSFPGAFQVPKYWGSLVALVTVVAALVVPKHLRWLYLAACTAYGFLLFLEVQRLLTAGLAPLHLSLWLALNVLITYMVFGARLGTGVNVALVGILMVSLITHGPLQSAALADWVTVCLVMGVTAVIAYTVTGFIENNMLMHAQDNEKLRAARQDALTDVYGRGAIEEELERAMELARKTNSPMSVIVTDIDHFKVVNDRYGHATGDDVLRAVAKRLRRNVGGTGGMVGRWGGEEFIVLLPGLAKPDALVLAERLRREISDLPLAGLDITASFGVASYRGVGDTTDQLFGRADMAMYEAKRSGRNAVR